MGDSPQLKVVVSLFCAPLAVEQPGIRQLPVQVAEDILIANHAAVAIFVDEQDVIFAGPDVFNGKMVTRRKSERT